MTGIVETFLNYGTNIFFGKNWEDQTKDVALNPNQIKLQTTLKETIICGTLAGTVCAIAMCCFAAIALSAASVPQLLFIPVPTYLAYNFFQISRNVYNNSRDAIQSWGSLDKAMVKADLLKNTFLFGWGADYIIQSLEMKTFVLSTHTEGQTTTTRYISCFA